jgi:CheY-like chemotaxis protein
VEDQAVADPIEILLIEDDPGDTLLTREAFADHKLRNRLVVATRPDLILLDLTLPGLDGRDVLGALAGDIGLRDIPVVVLTNSLAERDILRARDLRVADYVCKPLDFHRLVDVVKSIEQFAITVVRVATP